MVCRVAAHRREVHVHLGEVACGDVLLYVFELINDKEQIDGIMLSVVLYEVRDYPIHQLQQLIIRFIVAQSQFILFADVTCQVADVLMAPG